MLPSGGAGTRCFAVAKRTSPLVSAPFNPKAPSCWCRRRPQPGDQRQALLEPNTAAVSSGRKITEAEAVRARRDMVYAQHQVGWALDRLCELDGARWVYDRGELGAIRRDVMTILTHHAASRQAAMAPYGRLLLAHGAG
jgi:Acyl-CoA dehydrogenase, C-terminal domain